VTAVKMYLQHAGIEHSGTTDKDDMTVVNLSHCPFKGAEHTDGGPGILVFKDSGQIRFNCFHHKCQGKTWAQLQDEVNVPFAKFVYEVVTTNMVLDSTERQFKDPLLLAEKHVREHATQDGDRTFVCFGEDTFRYSDREGWLETTEKALAPWVRNTVQAAFDARARVSVGEVWEGFRASFGRTGGGFEEKSPRRA
jgi:hypothetical protein